MSKPTKKNNSSTVSLALFTQAALLLPGLLQTGNVFAEEEDSIDFQYSHFQEGRRSDSTRSFTNTNTGVAKNYTFHNGQSPIEVDSIHGSTRVSLTDRIKFAFNYIEDSWSGATPFGSAPENSKAFSTRHHFNYDGQGNPIAGGASPFANSGIILDRQGNLVYENGSNPVTGQPTYAKDRILHVMGFASPETRKQGDFNLSYHWDEAALNLGGGISTERDYESRFVNLGGSMDFNQKQTTVSTGVSYTNSDINALLDTVTTTFIGNNPNYSYITEHNEHLVADNLGIYNLTGNRQDWGSHLDVSQIISKDAILNAGISYTRSTGFLENPYKLSWIFGVDPTTPPNPDGTVLGSGQAFIEQRPDARNLWNWSLGWTQYVEPLDAAVHLNYQFAHDDWGINAHTFATDWVQPLGAGWALTPRIRYYSQEAADFYAPYFIVRRTADILLGARLALLQNFSSDQRPAAFGLRVTGYGLRVTGYGTLSGGLTLSKQFAKGIGIEAGFEYYTHQGGLKLGGGGEQAFADFDYWVANAALKVNLASLGQGLTGGGVSDHASRHSHPNLPAGVMFAHSLNKAGDIMAGYRYMHSQQAGNLLQGDHEVSQEQTAQQGCPGSYRADPVDGSAHFDGSCSILPKEMTMSMHMLELMYAPTDWLTLMLMPQFVDMQMVNDQPEFLIDPNAHGHGRHNHESGGIGDTGMYALVNLFYRPNHHVHTSLGLSAPTGDVGRKLTDEVTHTDTSYLHYGMQLGSGTWDFKPSLTYLGKAGDWNWGGASGRYVKDGRQQQIRLRLRRPV